MIEKLQKLLNHQKSCEKIGNIAEAQAFAGKIQELLLLHNLTMTEIEAKEQDENEPIAKEYVHADDMKRRRCAWKEYLAYAVARACLCRNLVIPGSNSLIFVGRTSDRHAAITMYKYLAKIAEDLAATEFGQWRRADWIRYNNAAQTRAWKESFYKGFVAAISSRLKEQRKAIEVAVVKEQGSSCTALVRINAHEENLQNFIGKKGRASAIGRKQSVNGDAFRRGVSNGQNVALKSTARLEP